MKKLLLLGAACLMVVPAMAQRGGECAYTPLQNLVMNARGPEEIQSLIQRNVIFDEQVRCGGSLMQLAIRRGNPQVLAAIVRQDQKRVHAQVTLDAFPISGAPKTIPLILFAAYYAPNKDIMELLVQAGANIGAVDDYGRNLLWYMDKNPVLKNTALVDELNNRLLYSMGNQQEGEAETATPAPEQVATPAAAPQKANRNAGLLDEQ
ncbi:MAG: hypothetical protein II942_02520 [Alphaproteobacteria bacterium]|nr:hypothetical protein [Alphaproteobacteria bacterium]